MRIHFLRIAVLAPYSKSLLDPEKGWVENVVILKHPVKGLAGRITRSSNITSTTAK
jgi:hypothetical protein